MSCHSCGVSLWHFMATRAVQVAAIGSAIAGAAGAGQRTDHAESALVRTQENLTFSVTGAVSRPTDWTVEELRRKFAGSIRTVEFTLKEKRYASHCLSLLQIVKASSIKTDPDRKNHAVCFAVIVRARDGYSACFSLAELQPDLGGRAAWVALDQDEKPLSPMEGPVKLVVPDDKKPARWVHAITSIVVIDGSGG